MLLRWKEAMYGGVGIRRCGGLRGEGRDETDSG